MTSYWHLSQTHLNILQTCPPLFQKKYLQHLQSFPNLTLDKSGEWGKLFHLKMQQYHAGLSLNQIFTDDDNLNESLKALIYASENLWKSPNLLTKKAEYSLTYTLRNFIFTAVYDLIILYPNKAIICDWKTFEKRNKVEEIENSWQTKLYLYMLTEKLNYLPEQISFEYWFIKLPNPPENLSIKYSKSKHDRTLQELNNLLDTLENLTNQYLENNIDFPHHNRCDTCKNRHLFKDELAKLNSYQNIPTSLDEIL
ncbi:PD-(D/E)XK nuclease family protein [Geminocystis sp. CENA526]|uniref:PD-(D/E)XK nuclease family protein n=1 Tax=Geminocystis sp. CENA526 TaxID=1355871 RepID=UPI003D6FFC86